MIGIEIDAPPKINIAEFQKAAEAVAPGSVVQVISFEGVTTLKIEAPDDADIDAVKAAVLAAPVGKTDAEEIIERVQKEQQEKAFDFAAWRSEVDARLNALEAKR